MENSSSGFKIKSLAKTTAHEQELGALMDLLHKKKKRQKEREDAVMSHVCRPRCYLWAAGARLGLSLPAGLHREERRKGAESSPHC